MATIDITRTELVWPGKYNDDGTRKEVPRVSLPFQVIETANESRATREAKKGAVQGMLFDVYEGKEGDTFDAGWRNKLIWGDNLLVMGSLLEKFAGKIDLIYIDPPFATGADFPFSAKIGDSGEEITKEQSAIEEKAYRDTWGRGLESYLSMLRNRLELLNDLLRPNGSIYIHCDWHVGHAIKVLTDEVFGSEAFDSEIIWKSTSAHANNRTYGNIHQNILFYAKDGRPTTFNTQYVDYEQDYVDQYYRYKDTDGRRFMSGDLARLSHGGWRIVTRPGF